MVFKKYDLNDVRNKLSSILGPKGLVDASENHFWQRDWLDKWGEEPFCVVRPSSTEQVSQVLKVCSSMRIPVVPRGGNTGLVGGGVLDMPGGIILSMDRMNNIASTDFSAGVIEVEAGCILEKLHQILDGSGYQFPMRLGSEGSAQIGGLLATNAGGSLAFRYGTMEGLVLGMEVVLSDGRIFNGMRAVQKDNSGYQLRKLFCGSEGTLGVITRAILKLVPSANQSSTALLAFKDMTSLLQFAKKLRSEASEFLSAIEFFSNTGLTIALENISNLKFPLSKKAPFYLLVEAECSSLLVPIEEIINNIIEQGFLDGELEDGVIATSENQRYDIWRLREEQPEGQRRLGYQLKHDISIPVSKLDKFLELAHNECNAIQKGVRINAFGHVGDGNVHFNLSPPIGCNHFDDLDNEFNFRLSDLASKLGGSFSAEHGLGRAKVNLADQLRDSVERRIMKDLKESLDKSSTLNPGVIVS